MTRLRLVLSALVVGVLVGTRARRRRRPLPAAAPLRLQAELRDVERRLTGRIDALDRERRRAGAVTFAITVLIVVPAALVASRQDVPDGVVAAVLAVGLVAAAVALLVAARLDRPSRRRP